MINCRLRYCTAQTKSVADTRDDEGGDVAGGEGLSAPPKNSTSRLGHSGLKPRPFGHRLPPNPPQWQCSSTTQLYKTLQGHSGSSEMALFNWLLPITGLSNNVKALHHFRVLPLS